jgi:geranylgeranyl diphosphate synthase type I
MKTSDLAPELNSVLNKCSKLVEPVICDLLNSRIDKKNREIVEYQILTGGKRLRPALAMISCQLLGGKETDALLPAAGLEIIHNYSLIVDDIIDNGTLRREKPTVWAKFGKSVAECVAIDYAAATLQAASLSKEPAKMSEIFAKAMKTIVDGEILDILFERQGREEEPYVVKNRYEDITEKEYFKMAGKKTAGLLEACCEAGGIVASAKEKELEALKDYGYNLGIAFQIQDDILDIFGDEKTFGKKIGKDIIETKGGNLVILFALKNLPKKDKERILEIMKKKKIENGDIKEAIGLISQTNSRELAYRSGKKFMNKAKKSLDLLPKNEWNEVLVKLADFVMERQR